MPRVGDGDRCQSADRRIFGAAFVSAGRSPDRRRRRVWRVLGRIDKTRLIPDSIPVPGKQSVDISVAGEVVMTGGGHLPNRAQLIGEQGAAAVGSDASRSVHSPAAYLANLLQLVDDQFTETSLSRNRPDISEIPLDDLDTDTEIPYLDVVNDVLARRLQQQLGADADQLLANLAFPIELPFSVA